MYLIQEIKKCIEGFNRQEMDRNSLGYLRNTYISEFNSQRRLCFLYDDKNAENKFQGVNFSGFTGKLRPKSKRKEQLQQSSFPHVKKTLFQSNEMLIHSENFKSNKNEALLYSGKNIGLTFKSLAFQSHPVLAS